MTHARVKARVQAVVQVSQGFSGGGLKVVAVGKQCGQCGRQGFACAGKNSFKSLKFFAVKHCFRSGKNVVNELIGGRDSGDQNIGHADARRCLGNVTRGRVSLAGPVRQQPAPQATVVANQHCGLWQQKLSKRILVAFDLAVVPPGQIRHISHKWYVGVVGSNHGDGADVLRAANKTDLDGGHRHVFQR